MVDPLGGLRTRVPDSPAKIRDAAQQFEALLLGQLLKGMRGGDSGLGDAGASTDALFECAEQEFAKALAARGGLGLARMIAAGLTPQAPAAQSPETTMRQEIPR